MSDLVCVLLFLGVTSVAGWGFVRLIFKKDKNGVWQWIDRCDRENKP